MLSEKEYEVEMFTKDLKNLQDEMSLMLSC